MNAGRLEIDLVAGIARLQRDTNEALGIVRGFASTTDSILKNLAAGISIGAVTAFAKSTVEAIAHMKDLGLEVGTSAEAISRFEAPTRSAGLSLDDTANAMFRMSKAALEARDPTSKAAQALQAIGISTSQLKGLKADEMFELVARQIAKYSDGISKNNVMMELFNKSGREMNRVTAEIATTTQLSATVTEQQALEAKKLGDQMLELKMNSEKFWRGVVSEGLPALNKLIAAFIQAKEQGGFLDGMFAALHTAAGNTAVDDLGRVNEQIDTMRKNVESATNGWRAFVFNDEERADKTAKLNALLIERARLEKVISDEGIREQNAAALRGQQARLANKGDPKYDPTAVANQKIGLDLLVKLREEYAKLNNETNQNETLERTLIELKKDAYKNLTPAREKEILDEAKLIDLKLREIEANKFLDAQHKADIDDTDKRGQAIEDLANAWQDATIELEQEQKLLGLGNLDRQKAVLLEKARLDIIAAGGNAAAIRDINENLQKQLGLLTQIDAAQESLNVWGKLSDMAGEFANALTHGVGTAFDYLKQQAKQLLAEMIALFAKRWVLQLAAGATGSSALASAAGQAGQGTLSGSLMGAAGSYLGSTAIGGALGEFGSAAMGTFVGPAAAGSAAAMGGAVYTAIMAIPVWGWIIGAIGALAYAFRDKGENWQATLGFGGNAHAYTTQGVFGAEGFQSIQGNDALNQQIQAFMASTGTIDHIIAATLSAAQIATITANLGGTYTQRNDGQPAQFAFGRNDDTAGQQLTLEYLQHKYGTIFDTIDKTFADFIRNYTGDSAGLMQAIGEFASVMSALQDSPVPGLDINSLRAMQREGEKLNDTFNRVVAGWSNYVSLFYSADEQHTIGMEALQHQLDQFGVTLPTTREAFRHLVETTEVGSPLWQALIGMAGAFSDLVPVIGAAGDAVGNVNALARGTGGTFGSSGSRYGMPGGTDAGSSSGGGSTGPSALESATQTLGQYASGLLSNSSLSALSPQDQLSAAERDWHDALMAAMGGDAGAMARLPGLSDHYLGVARSYYGSSSRYVDIFNQVSGGDRGVAGGDFQTTTINLQTQTNTTLTEIHGVLMEIRDRGGVGPEPVATVGLTEQARR